MHRSRSARRVLLILSPSPLPSTSTSSSLPSFSLCPSNPLQSGCRRERARTWSARSLRTAPGGPGALRGLDEGDKKKCDPSDEESLPSPPALNSRITHRAFSIPSHQRPASPLKNSPSILSASRAGTFHSAAWWWWLVSLDLDRRWSPRTTTAAAAAENIAGTITSPDTTGGDDGEATAMTAGSSTRTGDDESSPAASEAGGPARPPPQRRPPRPPRGRGTAPWSTCTGTSRTTTSCEGPSSQLPRSGSRGSASFSPSRDWTGGSCPGSWTRVPTGR